MIHRGAAWEEGSLTPGKRKKTAWLIVKCAALLLIVGVYIGCTLPASVVPYWSPEVTYSRGELVQVRATGGVINVALYVSKADGNLRHLPSVSPDWWMY